MFGRLETWGREKAARQYSRVQQITELYEDIVKLH